MGEQDTMLQIQLFGGFRISGGNGTVLETDSIKSEMITKLLSYLICHNKKNIGTLELSEALWPEGSSNNPAGALKNLVYRLRSILKNAWGDMEYVLTGRGTYQWNPEIKLSIDAENFNDCYHKVISDRDEETIINAGMEAVELYSGMFLPELSEEYWVMSLSTYYHSLYLSIVKRMARLLEKKLDYVLIEKLCQKAIEIDSLDEEIHCFLIKAMAADNKQTLAFAHYQEIIKRLYDDLGVEPSKELQKTCLELMKRQHEREDNISVVQEQLKEETDSQGAFFCEYVVFQKIYMLEARGLKRQASSIHLVLVGINPNGDSKNFNKIYFKRIKRGMTLLQEVLNNYLRSGDVICRYSVNQYLIMLPACTYDAAVVVMQRLQSFFYEKGSHIKLQYNIDEIDTL